MEAKYRIYNPHVGDPTEKITLHLSCRNLADLDTFTLSDPVWHLYVNDGDDPNSWLLFGKTEQIENNLNPDFVTHFLMDYYFEKEQRLKIEVFDVDITELEHIGNIETTLGEIMGSVGTTLIGDLYLPKKKKKKSRGKIILRAEKVATTNDLIYFHAKVKSLISNRGFFWGSNDPFFYIERARSENHDEFLKVFQSDPKRHTLNPTWMNMKHEAKAIWNGDYDWPLKFKLYSWRNSGYHRFYGEFLTSINQINNGVNEYSLFKDEKIVEGSTFTFEEFKIHERPSFFDFLHSGWKINLIMAIDFTSSNGEVTDPKSLHYLSPNGKLNDYQHAIKQVWAVLEPYSHNKMYPWYGFGGIPKYGEENKVSHWFNLNGLNYPDVRGVQGILEAYQYSLLEWSLYGPTMFAPWLRNTVDMIKGRLDQKVYHIYVILTDGDIHDMQLTKDIIVEGSEYPLSIIIIGLGDSKFTRMIELDGDEVILRNSQGRATKRDIVQFVKFNDYRHGSKQALAEQVLEEVPEQVVSYLVQNNIKLDEE